jgi:hypothetical protein
MRILQWRHRCKRYQNIAEDMATIDEDQAYPGDGYVTLRGVAVCVYSISYQIIIMQVDHKGLYFPAFVWSTYHLLLRYVVISRPL